MHEQDGAALSLAAAAATPARRWRPSPLVAGSMGLHALAAASAFLGPSAWPWALGSVVANHAVLGALGLLPRSTLLGPNLTRLPAAAARRGEIAITFDDGPEPEATPRILDLLDERGVRATFFCIAESAERHRDLTREIVLRGHRVENHSRRHHPTFPFLGLGGIRREIAAAQRVLAEASGAAPRYFRAPAGLRNPLLDPVLHALGLALVSWTRRAFDTRRSDARSVAADLVRDVGAGDILLLHDGHWARTAAGAPVVLEALPRVLDAIASKGLRPVTIEDGVRA